MGLQPGHVRHSVGPGVARLHHPITDHGTGHSRLQKTREALSDCGEDHQRKPRSTRHCRCGRLVLADQRTTDPRHGSGCFLRNDAERRRLLVACARSTADAGCAAILGFEGGRVDGAVVDWWDDDDELDGTEKTLISALESVLRFLIVIFGAILIANALDFNLTILIAGMGISGLAFALAAKDTISNFFGAITVLIDRPFKVGDWILTKNAEGEVVEIGLRTTLLRTSLDTIITLPNANLVSQAVENYGKRRWRRYRPTFHLDLDSNPAKVKKFCGGILR